MKKKRAVSNIIGSLIVLAVVASVGSVILFQGLNQINAFNYDLTLHDKEKVNELREDIRFQAVRFDSRDAGLGTEGTELELYLANVGSVDSTIVSVSMVKIDTQELIFNRVAPNPSEATILIEDDTVITLTNADLPLGTLHIWNSSEYGPEPLGPVIPPKYKITVGTAKGNFYDKVVSPWND